MSQVVLKTSRLILRQWKAQDLATFAAMNADERVMEFLHKKLDRAESDFLVSRIGEHFDRHGFGLWAVEVIGDGVFAGFVGLSVPRFQAHFTPCVEVGWRLAFEHWGKGYATEAARAAIEFGFVKAGLEEIVSFTVPENHRSRRGMQRLGMTHSDADDFEHPGLPEGDRLQKHVLYRLSKAAWESALR